MQHTKHNGYVMIWNQKNRIWDREHRLKMEQFLCRKLLPNEAVHHINGIRHDNRLENLVVLSCIEHGKIHGKEGKGRPRIQKEICSEKGCKNKSHAKGICNMHYMRVLRKRETLFKPI